MEDLRIRRSLALMVPQQQESIPKNMMAKLLNYFSGPSMLTQEHVGYQGCITFVSGLSSCLNPKMVNISALCMASCLSVSLILCNELISLEEKDPSATDGRLKPTSSLYGWSRPFLKEFKMDVNCFLFKILSLSLWLEVKKKAVFFIVIILQVNETGLCEVLCLRATQ